MSQTFNGASEPMRAIRDLIVLCESAFNENDEHRPTANAALDRARSGFDALRKLFGDERPAEDIEAAAMIEPPVATGNPCKLADFVLRLLKLPMNADVAIDIEEEFCGFTLEHHDHGDAHLISLTPE